MESDMIYVAFNYRLGAFGFLGGSEVQRNGVLNAGLLDQRLALEWIQTYIHLFGGSAENVTVMGESAGGGSILLHMGGLGAANRSTSEAALFSQAILQSPAIIPPSVTQPDLVFSDFLSYLNVTTLDQVRKLPSETVMEAYALQLAASPPTTYTYGPIVDGLYIRENKSSWLISESLDHTVKVMVSHNSFEGGFFFDPHVRTDDEFRQWLEISIAGLPAAQYDFLTQQLYPPLFDSSLGYIDQDTRQMALFGEAVIDCNFLQLNVALNGESYACECFTSIPKPLHLPSPFTYSLHRFASTKSHLSATELKQLTKSLKTNSPLHPAFTPRISHTPSIIHQVFHTPRSSSYSRALSFTLS
jgi:carboxylesterase type B